MRDVYKQMLMDGMHMIHARKLCYHDLQSDKFHTIFIMDGYDEKEVYKDVDTCEFYYENEDRILAWLESHIENKYLNACHAELNSI